MWPFSKREPKVEVFSAIESKLILMIDSMTVDNVEYKSYGELYYGDLWFSCDYNSVRVIFDNGYLDINHKGSINKIKFLIEEIRQIEKDTEQNKLRVKLGLPEIPLKKITYYKGAGIDPRKLPTC